ncbi:ATP-binding protein [Salipiger abyssi]|uniref:Serine/threonine-protein kinase RsbW n=1 Tax=Salipiger abyssi TaxID=1250539 RepID=A0A1P8UQB1_9RHOB|nr:ATP-binding protein [Salipiger abyssi]APZ51572.1 serine/threonine-protein kinase RsbW [Salipiger abyssi]
MPDMPDQRPTLALAFDFASTPAEVRGALGRVARGLDGIGWDAETRGAVELALAEALNNIVEHAYGGAPDGRIHLTLDATAGSADLVIRDSGGAMPGHRLPAGAPVDPEARGDLPEGGFGWYLIRRLASHLSYRRTEGCNRLEIHMRRADHAGGGAE